jgi:23S rRNA (cytidine1920-2'-O)/16S rRNA (cytidine1409-2'-O)-methyltransferase
VKSRLDILLLERELAKSREKAQSMIMAGEVLVNGAMVSKPAIRVDESDTIELRQKPPFVSRGGTKLAHALDHFQLDVHSLVALDVGASTGGFTDCLLKQGASRVYAVDVGYGQLEYSLRIDPRVVVMERINARYPFTLPEAVDLITMDISFISLEKVVPNVSNLTRRGSSIICLVKPQFEAGRDQVRKGGLIKDPSVHAQVLGRFISWSIGKGYRIRGLTPSPILGASGNREFFVLLEV